jgi:pre-mRNA cleavage complex 2 protein Pcf11
MVSATELEAIRQDYITSLDDLTFNSRPIITNLTIIAQENIQAAEVITRAIEEHISKVSYGWLF